MEAWRKKRARGDVIIVRYADDAVLGFQHQEDAEQFLELLRERLSKFGLELHPEVTEQLIDETVDGTLEPIKGNRERSTAMR